MIETKLSAALLAVLIAGATLQACTPGVGSVVASGIGQARDRVRSSAGELVDLLKSAEPHDRRWMQGEIDVVLQQAGCWWTADGIACTDWGDDR